MIHYGLQYERLLEMAASKLANAVIVRHSAQVELEKIRSKEAEMKVFYYQKADEEILLKLEFDGLVKLSPVEAVEEHNKKYGRYPI